MIDLRHIEQQKEEEEDGGGLQRNLTGMLATTNDAINLLESDEDDFSDPGGHRAATDDFPDKKLGEGAINPRLRYAEVQLVDIHSCINDAEDICSDPPARRLHRKSARKAEATISRIVADEKDERPLVNDVECIGSDPPARRLHRSSARKAEATIAKIVADEKDEPLGRSTASKRNEMWDRYNFLSSGGNHERVREQKLLQHSGGDEEISARLRLRRLRLERPLIYPHGDPEAVTITPEDLLRLRPNEFLNDSIIDLMMKRMQRKIAGIPGAQRFHFFSSFFYQKLCENDDRSTGHATDAMTSGSTAHKRVQRWTSKVNLFEKDFIFVPINQNLHWSLAIICHPWAAKCEFGASTREEQACLLHLDSLGETHRNIDLKLRMYLNHEWTASQKRMQLSTDNSCEDTFTSRNFRYFRCDVPQQNNYHDCGLFVIKFMELFVDGVLNFPKRFNMSLRPDLFPYFLHPNWFRPDEAGRILRDQIKRIVLDLAWGGTGCGSLAEDANLIKMQARGNETTAIFDSASENDESEVVLCESTPRASSPGNATKSSPVDLAQMVQVSPLDPEALRLEGRVCKPDGFDSDEELKIATTSPYRSSHKAHEDDSVCVSHGIEAADALLHRGESLNHQYLKADNRPGAEIVDAGHGNSDKKRLRDGGLIGEYEVAKLTKRDDDDLHVGIADGEDRIPKRATDGRKRSDAHEPFVNLVKGHDISDSE